VLNRRSELQGVVLARRSVQEARYRRVVLRARRWHLWAATAPTLRAAQAKLDPESIQRVVPIRAEGPANRAAG